MKKLLKTIIPKQWLSLYHKYLASVAAFVYGHPSRKMIIIGITGTKGKSTTGNILWKILTEAGHTVGLTGTANYRIGNYHEVSPYKMTMLGRFQLQKWLQRMVRAGCDVAIVETTSEGITQWRHRGIHYDVVALTNLTPEHLDSHGGFENYKKAKLALFEWLQELPEKLFAQTHRVQKTSVVNIDADYAEEFYAVGSYTKIRVGEDAQNELVLGNIQEQAGSTEFELNGERMSMPLLGAWNARNAALAAGCATALNVSLETVAKALKNVEQVPGRMELINAGQPFTVIVDYAYEPESLTALYTFFHSRKKEGQKLITLISSTGGGRDVGRRPKNGAVAAKYCDYVIVTDEDPYDDDPQVIIDQVAVGALEAGAQEGENMWRVLDRREAVQKAMQLAKPGDVVFLTAKGSEQKMCVAGGKKIPWDDRAVAREILQQK